MPSPALFRKRMSALYPADGMAEEQMSRIKQDEEVRVTISRVRNPKQLRYWWALCGILADYAEWCGNDKRKASDWLLLSIGHAEYHESPDGKTWCRPKSIAFGNCPQDQFDKILNDAIGVVVTKIIPNTSDDALRAELEAML